MTYPARKYSDGQGRKRFGGYDLQGGLAGAVGLARVGSRPETCGSTRALARNLSRIQNVATESQTLGLTTSAYRSYEPEPNRARGQVHPPAPPRS